MTVPALTVGELIRFLSICDFDAVVVVPTDEDWQHFTAVQAIQPMILRVKEVSSHTVLPSVDGRVKTVALV